MTPRIDHYIKDVAGELYLVNPETGQARGLVGDSDPQTRNDIARLISLATVIARAAARNRDAQNHYFRDRSQFNLIAAKQTERELDHHLKDYAGLLLDLTRPAVSQSKLDL